MGEERTRGNSAGDSGWVITQVAAEALGVDPRTVRTYISRGILNAKVEGKGVEKAYSVDVDSLYALRDARKSSGKDPREIREKSANAEDFAELIRDLTTQVVRTSSEAAALRTRLQLTERAQSSLEEEARALREERDRLRGAGGQTLQRILGEIIWWIAYRSGPYLRRGRANRRETFRT